MMMMRMMMMMIANAVPVSHICDTHTLMMSDETFIEEKNPSRTIFLDFHQVMSYTKRKLFGESQVTLKIPLFFFRSDARNRGIIPDVLFCCLSVWPPGPLSDVLYKTWVQAPGRG